MGWKDAPLVEEEQRPKWMDAPEISEQKQPEPDKGPDNSFLGEMKSGIRRLVDPWVNAPKAAQDYIQESANKAAESEKKGASSALSQGVGTLGATLGAPIAGLVSIPLGYAKQIGDATGLTGLASKGLQKYGEVLDKTGYSGAVNKIGESIPENVKVAGRGAMEIANVLPIDLAVASGIKATANMLKPNVGKAIEQGISKGIKPSVIGKPTLAKMEGFYSKAEDAVKTIADNRDKIKIVDDAGEAVTHPKTAAQAAQAIDQTKKLIYQQYHDMAVSAGEKGAVFDTSNILKKLDTIASSPDEILKTNDPRLKWNKDAREYANALKNELRELSGASPEIIEARITDLNNSLKGFYEGRTAKARAQIDGSVAAAMREELDNSIMSSVGDGYQELKNKYGALKAIENEVNKRALVNARKSPKGLFDISDVFTGGELAAGVLTMNPALIAKAAAGKGISQWLKTMSDPDRYIEKMFSAVYKDRPAQKITLGETLQKPVVAPVEALKEPDLNVPAFQRKGVDIYKSADENLANSAGADILAAKRKYLEDKDKFRLPKISTESANLPEESLEKIGSILNKKAPPEIGNRLAASRFDKLPPEVSGSLSEGADRIVAEASKYPITTEDQARKYLKLTGINAENLTAEEIIAKAKKIRTNLGGGEAYGKKFNKLGGLTAYELSKKKKK